MNLAVSREVLNQPDRALRDLARVMGGDSDTLAVRPDPDDTKHHASSLGPFLALCAGTIRSPRPFQPACPSTRGRVKKNPGKIRIGLCPKGCLELDRLCNAAGLPQYAKSRHISWAKPLNTK